MWQRQDHSDIRRFEVGDAPALTDLMRRSRAYGGASAAILEGYVVTPDQIARDDVFVASARRSGVLGFSSLARRGEAELDLLFVSDDAQGIGLGGELFTHLRAHAAGQDIATLRIVPHPPALGLYERQGAVRVGTARPTPRVSRQRPVLRLFVPASVSGSA